MRRRDFITLLGGAAAAAAATWPLAALAQQRAIPVIGFLSSESPSASTSKTRVAAFQQGLKELGFLEGQNVTIEYHWAQNQLGRLPELAADLVQRQVNVIVTNGAATAAAKSATSTIPIIFYSGADPMEMGYVATLSRPGNNLTGVANLNVELGPKRLELLHEAVPSTGVFALLLNPGNAALAGQNTKAVEAAAHALGLELRVVNASSERDFDLVFSTLAKERIGAMAIATDPLFVGRSDALAALALRHAMPTIFQYREFAAEGGLMSYGGSLADPYRLVGTYAGRVLRGEKPADLPVQQATKVELVINLTTARALGITLPLALLGRADEVIE